MHSTRIVVSGKEENLCNAPVSRLRASPENDELYGAVSSKDAEVVRLAIDIAKNGIREPLCVSQDNYVVSGHRRLVAAKLAKIRVVPVRVLLGVLREKVTPVEWKQILRGYNSQRVKSASVRLKEVMLDIDPEFAHKQLIQARDARNQQDENVIEINGEIKRSDISDLKVPMLRAAQSIITTLKPYWPLTVRQVHYQLLNSPPLRNSKRPDSAYCNDKNSYKDLSDLLTRARLSGDVLFESISDETRPTQGTNYMHDAADFVSREMYWFLRSYRRDLLHSQPDHIELVCEKMTVMGIAGPIAEKYCLPMTIGRGYCSLDPRKAIKDRYARSGKDQLKLIVVSDLDPDGDEIAESFARSLRDDFGIDDIVPIKAMLTAEQVDEFRLPDNKMEAKQGSANYQKFVDRYGRDAVYELEAIPPATFQRELATAIEASLDMDAFNEEIAYEKQDAVRLEAIKREVTEFVQSLDMELPD